MPSIRRAFSTTSIFLFTLGIIGLMLGSGMFIFMNNAMHFIPSILKVIFSLTIVGSSFAMITSLIGLFGGFRMRKILIYIYIGGTALTAIIYIVVAVLAGIGTVFPDWSLYRFWNSLNAEKKAFTEVAFKCCGWKQFTSTDCAYIPIPSEVRVSCYAKMFFPYNGFIILSTILGFLASVLCFSFMGLAIYFLINYHIDGPNKDVDSKKNDDYNRLDDDANDEINEND